jgi:hypothetical protein
LDLVQSKKEQKSENIWLNVVRDTFSDPMTGIVDFFVSESFNLFGVPGDESHCQRSLGNSFIIFQRFSGSRECLEQHSSCVKSRTQGTRSLRTLRKCLSRARVIETFIHRSFSTTSLFRPLRTQFITM